MPRGTSGVEGHLQALAPDPQHGWPRKWPGWMPFMGDSYPTEWVATLDALDKLDFDHIIGGHGTVKPRSHLTMFRNHLADLIDETRRARGRGESLAQAQASVAAALEPKYDAPMDGRFKEAVGGDVEKVYRDLEAGRDK